MSEPTNAMATSPVESPGADHGSKAAVVIGLDGTEPSWHAFSWALGEATRQGGRLIAVFVGQAPEASRSLALASIAGMPPPVAELEEVETEEAEELQREVRRQIHDGGLEVEFVHAQGDPAKELRRIADAAGARLIVVGRSAKRVHHLAGALGRRLLARREGPVVVVVP